MVISEYYGKPISMVVYVEISEYYATGLTVTYGFWTGDAIEAEK